MGISQINTNTNITFLDGNQKSFSKLTLSSMINKIYMERFENTDNDKSKKLKEINPFDGSFQIEMINETKTIKQDSEPSFIEIKSFAERAKEEGLV